jgi:hypothetical protein
MDITLEALTVRAEEIRSLGPDRPVAITASWSAEALSAVAAALSEQLARLRQTPAEDADQVLMLRQYALLADRFAEDAAAGANAILMFDDTELSVCETLLRDYVLRVNSADAGYQPPELREQLHTVRLVRTGLCEIVSEARAAAGAGRERPLPN